MSLRPVDNQAIFEERPAVVTEIENQRLVEATAASNQAEEESLINAVGHLDGLTETERSAAQLGVTAEEWRPISFLNKGHYNSLLKGNALAGNLAQKLEAYKEVSHVSGPVLSQ
jgi:hypothetical protein